MSHKSRQHRRRKAIAQIQLVALVLGVLCLALASALALSALLQHREVRDRLLRLATLQGGLGAILLVLRFFFYSLPEWRERHGSPSHQRRKDFFAKARTSQNPPQSQHSEGAVLVLVLVVLSLVAALLLRIQLGAQRQLHADQVEHQRRALQRAAGDAVCAALQRLADDPTLSVDTLDEPWAQREETKTPDGIATLVTVLDENRFFDLNNLAVAPRDDVRTPEDIVVNLFFACGAFDSGDRVRALRDWVDADDRGLAESPFYARRDPPYRCPDRPMLGAADLFQVAGWTPELFARKLRTSLTRGFDADLQDLVTVLPVPRQQVLPINVNTADRNVIAALLGVGEDRIANAIVTLRSMRPILSLDGLQTLMEPAVFALASPYLDVRSSYFRVEAQAFADGRRSRVQALAHRDTAGRVEVLQWIR